MADDQFCPNCGSLCPSNAPTGLCPGCLLQQGLDSNAFSLARGGTPAATMALASTPGGSSVLSYLVASVGTLPRVLLADTDPDGGPAPVVNPDSPEVPVSADSGGRLQILGELAQGGMGAILKGRDTDIGRDLAVKILLEQHREKPELIRRFIEEAQIAGQLQHPGIVPIYELGTFADQRPYFTMKLVKGRTLAVVLNRRTGPAVEHPRLLGIFLQVCHTVAYAHARGVIHRDLKPSNVMVGSFGEVQVMDWGLAKVLRQGGVHDDAEAGKTNVDVTIISTARTDSNLELSHAGTVLGTPAYMAPEQARGEINRVDERADVFAMGSILCEILTGRPAFTGRSPVEIQRKAARGDLSEAFARIDASGTDADLLSLARDCLAAEFEDRPRHAGEVAVRLASHLAGVQERLRAAELARAAESARALEAQRTAAAAELARAAEQARAEEAHARAAVERSRRRRTVALAASLLAMLTLGGVTFAYIAHERQARAAAVERLLGRASTLLDEARDAPEDTIRWRTAVAALQQVEDDRADVAQETRDRFAVLKSDAAVGLRDAERDATLLKTLVVVRANVQDIGFNGTDAAYADAFRAAELDIDVLSATAASNHIRRRPAAVVIELAAYLDDWSAVRRAAGPPAAWWRKPLKLARAVDADDYRDKLRALLLARDDRKALAVELDAMAAEPGAAELPAPTAVLLSGSLMSAGNRDAAIGLLRRAVARHPDDIWVNFSLATALRGLAPARREESVRYYTAARALRPETAHDLAHLLEEMGQGADALATFRDLVARQPDSAWHLGCLGQCMKGRGRVDQANQVLDRAVDVGRAALKLNPDNAQAHLYVGNALNDRGKPAEAEAEFRAVLTLRPDFALAHNNLGTALISQGKPAEAEAEFRALLKLKPDYAEGHSNLGLALSAQGKPDQAEAEFRAALENKPDYPDAHFNFGCALNNQGKATQAETEFRAALELKPDHVEAHYNLARILNAGGKPAEAEAEYRAALALNPNYAEAHCNLGALLSQLGRYAESAVEMRAGHELGSRRPDWRYPSAQWVRNIEQKAGLEARLPAVMSGRERPKSAAEAFAFAELCNAHKLYATAATLGAQAFEADPELAADRQTLRRYNAACAAALAGCGQGEDKPALDAPARAKLRGQALGWLKDELDTWSRIIDGGTPIVRGGVRQTLERWKSDADLAGVREEAALAKLPDSEREAWRALWQAVETLRKRAAGI